MRLLKEKKTKDALDLAVSYLPKLHQKAYKEAILLLNLAGIASCKLNAHREALEFHRECIYLVKHSPENITAEDLENFKVYEICAYYNLAVENLHLFLRADAYEFARKAAFKSQSIDADPILLRKVTWLLEEICNTQTQTLNTEDDSEDDTSNLTFIPGNLNQEKGSKIVQLTSETFNH